MMMTSTPTVSTPTTFTPTNSTSTTLNFASATKRNIRPKQDPAKREDGIIVETVEGILNEDYVYAFAEYTDPKNILYCSKLSNNRICIFFKDKTIVDDITKTHKYIIVDNKAIKIRPVVNPTKRLIISNACATIPHECITIELVRLGLKPVSEMNFLRAGFKRPEFAHVLSFRRSIYITDNNEQIPETTTITHDNIIHRIFISGDNEYCTFCKKHGHKIELCRFKIQYEQTQINTETQTAEIKEPLDTLPTKKQQITTEKTPTLQLQLTSKINNKEQNPQQTDHKGQSENLISNTTINPGPSTSNTTNVVQNINKNPSTTDIINIQQKINKNPPTPDTINTQQKINKNPATTETTNMQQKINKNPSTADTTNIQQKINKKHSHKRPATELSSAESNESLNDSQIMPDSAPLSLPGPPEPETSKAKKPSKNRRTRSLSPGTQTEDWLKPLKNIFDSSKIQLSIHQFQNFIDLVQNHPDPLTLAKEYIKDPNQLIDLMEKLHKNTSNRSGKTRLTRAINILESQTNEEN